LQALNTRVFGTAAQTVQAIVPAQAGLVLALGASPTGTGGRRPNDAA
jgi:hypothetical protein